MRLDQISRVAGWWWVGTSGALFGPLSLELNYILPQTRTQTFFLLPYFPSRLAASCDYMPCQLRWPKSPWSFSALISLLLPLLLATHFTLPDASSLYTLVHFSSKQLTSMFHIWEDSVHMPHSPVFLHITSKSLCHSMTCLSKSQRRKWIRSFPR